MVSVMLLSHILNDLGQHNRCKKKETTKDNKVINLSFLISLLKFFHQNFAIKSAVTAVS